MPYIDDAIRDYRARIPEATKARAAERYARLARTLGEKLGEFDLTKHPEPFEVEVDVTTVPFDRYEVPSWQFGVGATHTARTTGALHITGDGRMLMLFTVRPLTPRLEVAIACSREEA